MKERALAHSLAYGVGYVHEGMDDATRGLVELLFTSGAIQVRVCVFACVGCACVSIGC